MKEFLGILYALALFGAVVLMSYAKHTGNYSERTKIAVIDTGINEDLFPPGIVCGRYDTTGMGIQDTLGHGTLVAGLISKAVDPDKQCLVIIKWAVGRGNNFYESERRIIKALQIANAENVSFVNMSMNGKDSSNIEEDLITQLLNKGVKVVVSAGNERQDLSVTCDNFPACYNKHENFFVVGSVDNDDFVSSFSNYNGPVNAYERGIYQCFQGICASGTSMSAANWTARLVREAR